MPQLVTWRDRGRIPTGRHEAGHLPGVRAGQRDDGDVVEEYVDTAYATAQPPVYLWVPEYQRTHWAQYCREYGAYGVPVYFVDDGWYRDNVMRRNWTTEQRSEELRGGVRTTPRLRETPKRLRRAQ